MRVSSPFGRNFPHHPPEGYGKGVKKVASPEAREHVPVEGAEGFPVAFVQPPAPGDAPVEEFKLIEKVIYVVRALITFDFRILEESAPQKRHDL